MKLDKLTINSEGIIKTENVSLVRDLNSKALLSTDKSSLESHRKQIDRNKMNIAELNTIKDEVDDIKKAVSEIKNLLIHSLEK